MIRVSDLQCDIVKVFDGGILSWSHQNSFTEFCLEWWTVYVSVWTDFCAWRLCEVVRNGWIILWW